MSQECTECGRPATVVAVDDLIAGGWGDPFCDDCAETLANQGYRIVDKV